jgi:RimJ/RimL family protein N-acetyltransferase
MLHGETTRLRALEPGDAERAYRWVNDREVTQYLSLRYPLSMPFERDWAEAASKPNSYANVQLAIEIAATDEHIGNCGLHGGESLHRVSELGVMIGAKEHWGHGYGFDALRTLVVFGFRDLNLRRIYLQVAAPHVKAIALYERLGFEHEGRFPSAYRARGYYFDILQMAISRARFDELYGATEEVGDVPRG